MAGIPITTGGTGAINISYRPCYRNRISKIYSFLKKTETKKIAQWIFQMKRNNGMIK